MATDYDAERDAAIGDGVGLYDDSNLLRIVLECSEIAMRKGDDLSICDFNHLDLLHYQGLDSLRTFSENNIDSNSHVIDLGAGVGGSSRFIAATYNCQVSSIEIQEPLMRVGRTLNFLQKLHSQINYSQGDITKLNKQPNLTNHFDVGVSQLVFLHIPNKEQLFKSIHHVLKPGGLLYVEDFFRLGTKEKPLDFTNERLQILSEDISVPDPRVTLLSKEDLIHLIEQCGFEVIVWNDKTNEWIEFVWDRYERFLSAGDTCNKLGWFYQQMCYLYHENEDSFYQKHPLVTQRLEKIHHFQKSLHPQALGGVQYVLKKI